MRPGIDKVSIQMFESNLEQNLLALMTQLKDGTFRPRPLRRVHIPKGGGKTRPLGIPAVRDRVAQEVLRQLLSPLFERIFHDDSYGFRPGRNCHQAVERVLELHRQGHTYVLDADIKGFFDNIPHQVIMAGVSAEVADGNILRSGRTISQGRGDGGWRSSNPRRSARLRGASFPPCSPTSLSTASTGDSTTPASASCVTPTTSWSCAGPRLRSRRHTTWCNSISTALGLTLSAEKTKIGRFREGFAFLGFRLSSRSVTMRPKTVEKFKTKIRELTPRHHNLDARGHRESQPVVRGTANYFATAFSTCVRSFAAWTAGYACVSGA